MTLEDAKASTTEIAEDRKRLRRTTSRDVNHCDGVRKATERT
jgi:hypothetical protein